MKRIMLIAAIKATFDWGLSQRRQKKEPLQIIQRIKINLHTKTVRFFISLFDFDDFLQ